MDKTWLIKNYTNSLNTLSEVENLLESSKETQLRNYNCKTVELKLQAVRKEAQKERDVTLLLSIELISMVQDLNFHANSNEQKNSLKNAIDEIKNAIELIPLVKDKEFYKKTHILFSKTKSQEAGLPLDAFRLFIKSHTARLNNQLRSGIPASQKNLLRQRIENMKLANELYKDLQRGALNITKKQGLSR